MVAFMANGARFILEVIYHVSIFLSVFNVGALLALPCFLSSTARHA
jgi:hypothetical protein